MNRNLIFHGCIFVALLCVALLIWSGLPEVAAPPTAEEIEQAREDGTLVENPLTGEETIEGWKSDGMSEGGRVLTGIALLIVIAGYAAIIFTAYLLPDLVHRFTHMFYGSDEQAETDPMHDARALFAQGEFQGAIEAYRDVAKDQPENRFPWIEIAKIQHDNLEDTDAAIATLRRALESHEWRVNDATFLMFRLADLYEVDKGDQQTAVGILQQVVDMFPETRHAANATHRLRELGAL